MGSHIVMILITGGNGQLGQALQHHAPSWAEVNAIDIEDCDLADIPMLRARLVVEAPDLIINAAGCKGPGTDSEIALAVNAHAVAAMVEAVDQTGGKLVQISTNLVFDGLAEQAYCPGDRRNPLCLYGWTKAAGEDYLRKPDLIVRTGLIYSGASGNFVQNMITLMSEQEHILVPDEGIGAMASASTLARTVWGLIEKQATGVFHHCDEGVASWREVVETIADEAFALGLIAKMPVIHVVPDGYASVFAQLVGQPRLNCSATRALLADAQIHVREGLRQMVREGTRLA